MISVIIPTHNGSAYLEAAINSALHQSCPPNEVIVIDDGSSDQTQELVANYQEKVVYHKQEHLGASAARNTGVELARGEFLAFLDADDVWDYHKLALQLQVFSKESSPHMAFSFVKSFYSPDCDASIRQRLICPTNALPGYCPTTFFTRKKSFLRVGFFDSSFQTGEFIDWYIRAKKEGLSSHLMPTTLAYRRIHQGHIGKKHSHQNYCQVIKQALSKM